MARDSLECMRLRKESCLDFFLGGVDEEDGSVDVAEVVHVDRSSSLCAGVR